MVEATESEISTRNPEPQTWNPKPEPETREPKPETRIRIRVGQVLRRAADEKLGGAKLEKFKSQVFPKPFSSSLLLPSLELSDTQVYAPQIRALFGTASHLCEEVFPKPETKDPKII